MKYFRAAYLAFLAVLNFAVPTSGQAQEAAVINLNARWHFKWVGNLYRDLYSDGRNELLCVQTNAGQYALWNPSDDTLSKPLMRKCGPTPVLHRTRPKIDGLEVSTTGVAASVCAQNFEFYYTVVSPNGRATSFYVISKLASPQQQDEYWCRGNAPNNAKFSQAYDEILVNFMTLEDGTLLLAADSYAASSGLCSACWSKFAAPTLLRFKAMPDSIWSSGTGIFVVPKPLVEAALNDQNDDNRARYEAVMKAIGEHRVN